VGGTKEREFSHQFLKNVIGDNTACSPQLPNADRAIIVVRDSLIFPEGTDREPVSHPEHRNALFFHVRFSYTRFTRRDSMPTSVTTFDEVGHMLGPLHPHHFDVAEPNGSAALSPRSSSTSRPRPRFPQPDDRLQRGKGQGDSELSVNREQLGSWRNSALHSSPTGKRIVFL